jgi:hypothetical protein
VQYYNPIQKATQYGKATLTSALGSLQSATEPWYNYNRITDTTEPVCKEICDDIEPFTSNSGPTALELASGGWDTIKYDELVKNTALDWETKILGGVPTGKPETFGNNRVPEDWAYTDFPRTASSGLDMAGVFPQSPDPPILPDRMVNKLWGNQ